jgi:hypothetical protein
LRQAGSKARSSAAASVIAFAALGLLHSIVPGAGVAYAQNTNATISGQVLDPQGALIPKAHVLVVNQDNGITVFNGISDSAGAFVAPEVLPGTYRITVNSTGLEQAIINDLIATVGQVASIRVHMQIGASTETVTVSAKGEQLDFETTDISTLIAPSDVQNLPLQQRATENLLAFIPGVVHGGAADTPSTSQLSINGSRTLNTEVLLNGVSTIIASTGTPGTLPSPDGVDSFRVFTTNAPAEYGRTSGAVISVNTLSGTNDYHGNLYSLARNEVFDANTYFHKLTISSTTGQVTPRARDRFFQEGGSVGGPVRVPHLYNGHNKTFFFVNYDYTISPNSNDLAFTVPTAAQRTGDLSSSPQKIYQPTGAKSAQFANNQIGPIDPAAAKILALMPLPNSVGTFDATDNRYTGNWTSEQNTTGHVLKLATRLDEAITPNDRISVNVYRFKTTTPNAISWLGATDPTHLLNTTWNCTCNNAWLPSIDYTRLWSSSLVMDLNFGVFRNVVLRVPPGTSPTVGQTVGIASLPLSQMPELTSGPGSFSNVGSDTNTNQVNITNTFTPFGTLTKTLGPHTFKAGASLRKNEFNSYNPAASPEGTLGFDGSITNHGSSGNPNTGLADFLLGLPKSGSYELPMPETGRRNWNLGIFAQDDYKVTPKLTLNLGIRYEYESPMKIANNIYSRFDTNTGNMLVAGNNASASLNLTTAMTDFAPRVGAAYSVNGKTVIRAAFGVFYGTIFQNLGGQLAYPGFDVTYTYPNQGTAVPLPFTLSQGFQLNAVRDLKNPFVSLASATPSVPYSASGVEFHDVSHMSQVLQRSFGIERSLPLGLSLEVDYVGNEAHHLAYSVPYNYVPYSQVGAVTLANTTLASQEARPFPTLSSINGVDDVGNSNYNGLQVSIKRQFDKRLAVLSNYTYSKSLDDGSTIYNFSAPNGSANAQYTVDAASRRADFTTSNIDATQVLNIGLVYTTPGPWWTRDWHISPIFVGHTGLPVNITQSNEITNVSQQRPNGSTKTLKVHPTVTGAALQYLDSATDTNFPLTPSGPVYSTINGVRTQVVSVGLGTTPRDSVREPGDMDFDASVAKDFKIYERFKFQFRMDAFNVINHANFTAPSGSLTVTATGSTATFNTSSGFGKITGTQAPRQMQASARFFF